MLPADSILELNDISFEYGEGGFSLRGITVQVNRGQVTILAGANGSGKSTLLDLLGGDRTPTLGDIRWNGEVTDAATLAHHTGFVSASGSLFDYLTVEEHLRLFAQLWSGPKGHLVDRLDAAQLNDQRNSRAGALSLGQRQRLAFALATFNDPDVLLLDEPLNGLDHDSIAALCQSITDRSERDKATLIATHIVAPLESLADQLWFLDRGRLVFADRPEPSFTETLNKLRSIEAASD